MKKITLLLLVIFSCWQTNAQVSSYIFSQNTGTYSPLSGGVVLATQTAANGFSDGALDDVNYTVALPFSFSFNGVTYASGSNVYVNSNGFVSFGTAAPTAATYGPIGSTNVYDGAVSAFGLDMNGGYGAVGSTTTGSNVIEITAGTTAEYVVGALVAGTGIPAGSTVVSTTPTSVTISANCTSTGTGRTISVAIGQISYQVLGTSPNQQLVFQYTRMRPYNTSLRTIDFQIVLNETTNVIEAVYGFSIGSNLATSAPQVGLRGATNAAFNNRTSTTDWSATTPGTTNTNTVTFSSTVLPTSGLKFIWTPSSCLAPSGLTTSTLTTTSATVSWLASTSASSGYEYIVSTTNTNPTGAGTANAGTSVSLTSLSPNTTYYFWVRSNCGGGNFSSWSTFSFFTGYCLPSGTNAATYIDSFSTNAGITNITNNASGYTTGGYQDNYNTSNVTSFPTGSVNYSFSIVGGTTGVAIWIDWNNNLVFETTEIAYTSNTYLADGTYTGQITVPAGQALGSYRMRIRTDWNATNPDPCAVSFNRTEAEDYKFTVITQPTDSPDYVSLQWPPTATIAQGGSVTVYGQVYEGGLTDVAPNINGQAPGINAWVGYSTTNTNPNTWTTWVASTHNAASIGNNDEYQANIGATLAPGTYYYATRFQLNGGAFVYGGINQSSPNNGNFWDGTTFVNGILTVTPPPAPANDECSSATALTVGGTFAAQLTNGTNVGATTSSQTAPTTCFGFVGNDVWYSVVVPASGSLTIETGDSSTGATGLDTVITIYSGDCNQLTQIDCDDDGAATGAYSFKSLTGLTPGTTLYIRVYEYSNDNAGGFGISAYDASLSNNSFDSSNFKFYPNPVKNVLNLSYSQEITTVEVFNMVGQKVSSNTLGATTGQVDMSQLSNGVYLVKIVTANNQSETIRVIKE